MAIYGVDAGTWKEAADPPPLVASAHGWASDHVAIVGVKGCAGDTTCAEGQPSAWNYSPSTDRWSELDTALGPVDVETEWSVEDPVVRGAVAIFPFGRTGLLAAPPSGRATPASPLTDGIYWSVCASQGRILSVVTPSGRASGPPTRYSPNTVELRSRPISSAMTLGPWERPANAKPPTSVNATEIQVNACTGDGGVLTDDQGQTSFWSGRNGGEWELVTPSGSPPREVVFGGALAADGDAVIVGDREVFRLDTGPGGIPSAWRSAPLPRRASAAGPVSHLHAVAGNRVFVLAVPSRVAGASSGGAGEPSIHEVLLP